MTLAAGKGLRLGLHSMALAGVVTAAVCFSPPGAFATSTPMSLTAAVPEVAQMPSSAYAADAPDPDITLVGSTYYLYTTGTTWGNHIGVLTSPLPTSGWQTITGQDYGSSALPYPPSWEKPNTQTAPGVFFWDGRYVMYYAAVDTANGHYCITIATSPAPAGPFSDTSSGPFICQTTYGGSIDPSPFVGANGQPWLVWKSNDGSSSQPAHIWSARLSASGLGLVSAPVTILDQNTVAYPWETTIENPDLVLVNGAYYLFFSGGAWNSSGYAEGYAICSGPAGPCTQPQDTPILSSYGNVAGPAGASLVSDPQGRWWMAYAAWTSGCTSYSCGGARELYVGGVGFGAIPPDPPAPVITSVFPPSGPTSGGTSVTITGAGLTGASAVNFGNAAAKSFYIASATQITAVSPSVPKGGEVAISVVTPDGMSSTANGCADGFDFGSTPPTPSSSEYVPLDPTRIADTRTGSQQPYAGQTLGACSSLDVQVAGAGGVPSSGVSAAFLNVTALSSGAGGFLVVYPADSQRPLASNLNFAPDEIVANLVSVPLNPSSGQITVYNGSHAPVNVVIDVQGYVVSTASGNAGLYVPISPVRLCDTRTNVSYTTPCTGDTPGPGQSVTVPVGGEGTIPSIGVSAVVLNVTAVDSAASGFLTVYPSGYGLPTASNVNYYAGQTVANRVIVPVGPGGSVKVYSSAGSPGIVVDAVGYFTAAQGSQFYPLSPSRICDTRPASVSGLSDQCTGYTLIPSGETLTVHIAGNGGVPASGAIAVVANVTVTSTDTGSFLVAYPSYTISPTTSDLNWSAGQTIANLVIVELSANGYASFTNHSGSTDVIVDVVGWFG
ncbi:MAG: family 43 glycosylhydrolase [Acidimicrobiales bacterium]